MCASVLFWWLFLRTYVGRGVGAHFFNDIMSASRYLYLVSRWISPKYADRLVSMARSGVEVRVITSDDWSFGHQAALDKLKRALSPPLLFGRDKWVPPNLELGIIKQEYLHVKMYVADDRIAVVGSANFTESGLWNNIEHVIVFTEPHAVGTIKNDFLTLWRLYTEERKAVKKMITLDDIAKELNKSLEELAELFRLRK